MSEQQIPLDGSAPAPAEAPKPNETTGQHDIGVRVANLNKDEYSGLSDIDLAIKIANAGRTQLIPWESCSLPTDGYYYGWTNGNIKVRAMGQQAEKWLTTVRYAETGENIDMVFRECVKFPDPEFQPTDLLAGDRIFLLYYIRGITHGNIYEFGIKCANPDCAKWSNQRYDLNNLVGTIKRVNKDLGYEPFKITLPYLSQAYGRDVWVEVRFLRGSDLNNMAALRLAKKKQDQFLANSSVKSGRPGRVDDKPNNKIMTADDAISENLEMIILSFLGNQDRALIKKIVSDMHSMDTAAIREWLEVNTPGIDTVVTVTCPNCGTEFPTQLPITETFFRPAKPQVST